jgi:hypothetical protein
MAKQIVWIAISIMILMILSKLIKIGSAVGSTVEQAFTVTGDFLASVGSAASQFINELDDEAGGAITTLASPAILAVMPVAAAALRPDDLDEAEQELWTSLFIDSVIEQLGF